MAPNVKSGTADFFASLLLENKYVFLGFADRTVFELKFIITEDDMMQLRALAERGFRFRYGADSIKLIGKDGTEIAFRGAMKSILAQASRSFSKPRYN